MADLGSKATDGRLSFTKYVTDNKRFLEVEYQIEKGKSAAVYTKKGNNLVAGTTQYKAGTKLKIINKDMFIFGNMKFAQVKISSRTGYILINCIRKPTAINATQYEDEVVDAINGYILSAGGKIDIKLKGDTKIYKDISFAIKVDTNIKRAGGVRGDPKADIILCKDKKDPTGSGSIYVSHKKEGGPEAFQQYGGLSEQAGSQIYNHRLVQKFLGEVAKVIGNSSALAQPIIGIFKDTALSNLSIYGPDYGKAFSIQHTHLIGQGKPVLKDKGKYVELDFSSHMSLSGDLSHFSGGYLPVFGATFRAGRGFDYKGKRYTGARVAIYPYKLMATRGSLLELKIT